MKNTFKKISESETVLTELMIPSYANFGGKVHGGVLLSLMDKVAYVCATMHSGEYCVTVAVEGVEFLTPVEVGELVSFKASVNYVGTTTMIVGIRVESIHPKHGNVKHTNSCYFTMVAKNDEGKPTEVPGLIIETEQQLRRFYEGMELKKMSIEKRKMLHSEKAKISFDEMKKQCSSEKVQLEIL